ncbi:MAG TPA: hypothetical protein VF630_03550 [Hymenobacter sp.]|jgi:hypothetical protein
MLTSLRGIYANGTVHLTEPAPPTSAPVEVVVVFLEPDDRRGVIVPANAAADLAQSPPRNEQMLRLQSSWQRARALAAGMTGSSLSEEVLADRQEGN